MTKAGNYKLWLALILSFVLAVTAAYSVSNTDKAKAQTAAKPNIVFIMSDDQPQSTVKAMPNVRTRIRDVGLNALNFYVSQSLCCPSRASTLKGQYPHNTGILKNGPPQGGHPDFMAIDDNTVATQLTNRGYQTGLIGKYMNEYSCPYTPPGWGYWFGKDDVGNPGEKACENGNMIDYTGDPGNWGDRIQGRAMDFLDRRTDQSTDPPFAMFMWTSQPHLGAADYADRYEGLYAGERVPKTPAWDEADVSDKPQWVKDLPRISAEDETYLNQLYRNQLRSSRQIDDTVGKVLDLLRDRGELDNTYVVYMTDNNTHMGEHRWWTDHGAKNTSYEEGANVMFYVRGPGIPAGTTTNELYSNNDLAPTFNKIAGGTPPAFTDGRSLLAHWKAPGGTLARTGLMNERGVQSVGIPVPVYHAIMTKTHTYTEYETGEREYYNRLTDPDQLNNVYSATNPSTALRDQLQALKTCAGDSCTVAENQ